MNIYIQINSNTAAARRQLQPQPPVSRPVTYAHAVVEPRRQPVPAERVTTRRQPQPPVSRPVTYAHAVVEPRRRTQSQSQAAEMSNVRRKNKNRKWKKH